MLIFKTFIIGFFMGSADLVPGVSGGTIAFISGIYERLISTIKWLTSDFLKLLLERKFQTAFKQIPFSFLVPLATGLFTAILTLSSLIGYLLHEHPILTWSFFMGLILASIHLVSRRIPHWNGQLFGYLAIAAFIAYAISGLVPATTPANPLAFFFSGSIAIIAMILPGVSGSFLLIILGKYQQVLQAVHDRDVVTLGIFMLGAIIGLALFSKLLTYLFKHHHDATIATLTGFMIGSLRKVWPWKITTDYYVNSDGLQEPLTFQNVMPEMNTFLLYALLVMVLGAALIIILERQAPQETIESHSA